MMKVLQSDSTDIPTLLVLFYVKVWCATSSHFVAVDVSYLFILVCQTYSKRS